MNGRAIWRVQRARDQQPGAFALRVTYAVSLAGNGCRGSGLLMVVSTRDHCLLTMGYPAVAE